MCFDEKFGGMAKNHGGVAIQHNRKTPTGIL